MTFSKNHILIFSVAFTVTVFAGWIVLPSKNNSQNLYFRQSFDLRRMRLDNSDIQTVKIGEKINAANIKTLKNETISSFADGNLFLLVLINPDCQTCNISKDLMSDIRQPISQTQILYFPLLIADTPTDEMENYAKSLGFERALYVSSNSVFSQMLTPSHILIDKNGTVIQIWFGSSNDKETRKRIGYQISSDLFLIQDVLQWLRK